MILWLSIAAIGGLLLYPAWTRKWSDNASGWWLLGLSGVLLVLAWDILK